MILREYYYGIFRREKIDVVSNFDFKRLKRLNEQVLQKLYVTTVI